MRSRTRPAWRPVHRERPPFPARGLTILKGLGPRKSPARSLERIAASCCESQEVLSAGDANYDRRNIFHIDECVEIRLGRCTCPPAVFPARQIRKVDDTVSHLGDF